MKLKLYRLVFWLWFITKGYYRWSRFWRWVLERKYRKQKLTKYKTLEDLEHALGQLKWKRDPLMGMFDVISRPEKVEYQLKGYADGRGNPVMAYAGDCDESAIYAAVSIKGMMRRSLLRYCLPYFMSFTWFDKDGVFHGHNVCAFWDTYAQKWGHIGNWYGGRARIQFDSLSAVARDFVGDGTLIAWAVASPDLKELVDLRFA